MKLENQVVSLDLAKRLKELGAKQESYFAWLLQEEDGNGRTVMVDSPCLVVKGYSWEENCFISAFTVAELGEMLPDYVNPADYQGARSLGISKAMDGWHVTYSTQEKWWHREVADTEVDARAKMLCYLLENKLITL